LVLFGFLYGQVVDGAFEAVVGFISCCANAKPDVSGFVGLAAELGGRECELTAPGPQDRFLNAIFQATAEIVEGEETAGYLLTVAKPAKPIKLSPGKWHTFDIKANGSTISVAASAFRTGWGQSNTGISESRNRERCMIK
jgi:hypothetical protein